jgi:hypothetical protein
VLLALRAAEERGDPMPPVQDGDLRGTGWTPADAPGDAVAMEPPEFACRVCDCREFVAVGQSRKGAAFYSCTGCSRVFTDPAKASKPPHELILPGIGHLIPQRTEPRRK